MGFLSNYSQNVTSERSIYYFLSIIVSQYSGINATGGTVNITGIRFLEGLLYFCDVKFFLLQISASEILGKV